MTEHTRNGMGADFGSALAEREVVEVPLLLPLWQVAALATAAQDRGLTTGQMVRHVLHDFIQGLEDCPSSSTR